MSRNVDISPQGFKKIISSLDKMIDEIQNTNDTLQRETSAIRMHWKDSLYEDWKAKVNRKYRIQLKKIQDELKDDRDTLKMYGQDAERMQKNRRISE